MSQPLEGRRVAVIGGAGFIGHHLALKLAARQAHVEIIDSLQVNNLLWFQSERDPVQRQAALGMLNERLDLLRRAGIPLHPQDARDYHALSRLLSEIRPSVVVHLAAVSHAARSNKDPYSTFDHSLRTLENALDYSRGTVEQFVYLSSSMVYGNFLQPRVTEEHPLNPIGIYGALKLAGEKMVIAYQQVFDLTYTIVRPSALYGPRCVSRRVSQIFVENALRGLPLTIAGDGKELLDFTYIDDLVDGICLAIGNAGARNETVNLTYGAARSVADLVEVVRQHFPDLQVQHVERDNLMPMRGTLSVDRAVEKLGYAPAYPIEMGMARYIAWYREHLQSAPAPAHS